MGWLRASALTCCLICLGGVKWSCLQIDKQAFPPCYRFYGRARYLPMLCSIQTSRTSTTLSLLSFTDPLRLTWSLYKGGGVKKPLKNLRGSPAAGNKPLINFPPCADRHEQASAERRVCLRGVPLIQNQLFLSQCDHFGVGVWVTLT